MRFGLPIVALVITNELLVLGQGHPAVQGDSRIVLSTSEAVDIARRVGRDQGIDVGDRKHVTLDLLTTKDGKPMLHGYMTLGIYRDLELLIEVSINEKTGQLVDSDNCTLYDYPDIRYLQEDYAKSTGLQPLTMAELSSEVGCESLKVLRAPISVPKKRK